jgi:pimeloyl-ACP methyl ester carboxylesterase
MKKYRILTFLLLFTALCLNVFGQTTAYPFEVKKSGKGKQAIIFIPGFASSGDVWNETRAKFEKDYTCYTLTMAGFAGVPPQADPTFKKWTAGIAAYISDNNIEKPVLIGHSMGGALAMAVAADFPALPGKIVVVDALPCLAALMNPSFQSKEQPDCMGMINQMTAMPDEQFQQMQQTAISRLLADTLKRPVVINWSLASDRKTFGSMYCDFYNTDLREKISQISCPSLILLESYFLNIKSAIENQYKNLPGAKLQYASKGLHFIMYDDTDWYLTQLDNFLTAR